MHDIMEAKKKSWNRHGNHKSHPGGWTEAHSDEVAAQVLIDVECFYIDLIMWNTDTVL